MAVRDMSGVSNVEIARANIAEADKIMMRYAEGNFNREKYRDDMVYAQNLYLMAQTYIALDMADRVR